MTARRPARSGLERTVEEQAGHIAALRERVDFLSAREQELKESLQLTSEHCRSRESELNRLADEEIRERDARIAALEEELRALNRMIQMMQSTRVWRVGTTYWSVRGRAKHLLTRG